MGGGYLVELPANVLFPFNFGFDLLGLVDELFLELFLEIVFGSFPNMECSVELRNHV